MAKKVSSGRKAAKKTGHAKPAFSLSNLHAAQGFAAPQGARRPVQA